MKPFGAELEKKRLSSWYVLCLVCCAVVPFLNGLFNDFTYDDKIIIRDNPRLASPSSAGAILTTHYFGGSLATGQNYRPVILATYAVQRWVHGNRAPLFRAVNILLHVSATLLAYLWIRRLGLGDGLAFASTLWFASAAIHVEAVTSLVGRAEVLAACFVLLSALLWLEASQGEQVRTGLYLGALVSFLLGVFVKESAVVVPGVVLLGEAFRDGRFALRFAALLTALRRRAVWLVGLLLPVGVLFLVRLVVLEGFLLSRHAGIFEVENPLVVLSAPLRVVNGFWLLGRYALSTLLPLDLAADHSAHALRLLTPRDSVLVVATMAGVLALAVLAVILRSRVPAFSFGLFLFAGTFLPAANILFPIGTIYAERLAYLPSLGLLVAVLALFQPREWAVPRPGRIRWREIAVALLVVFNTALAVERNRVWRDDTTLFTNMVARRPGSAKARYNLAYDLYRRGKLAEARQHLETAITIFPRHYDAHTLLGRISQDEGNLAGAIRSYRTATGIFPTYERVILALASALEEKSEVAEAGAVLAGARTRVPESSTLAMAEARLFEKKGEWSRAVHAWRRARILDRGAVASRMGLSRALRRVGRFAEARSEARWVLYFDPSRIEARFLLAEIYEEEGKPLPACVELTRAFRSSPSDAVARQRLFEFIDRHPEFEERAFSGRGGRRYLAK